MPHQNNTWRGGHQSRRSDLSFGKLTKELHELLEIPNTVHYSSGGFRYERPETGALIIRTIVKTMVDALQREEDVIIPGFGRFSVEARKVRSGGTLQSVASNGDILGLSKKAAKHGPKKYVIFYPSAHLTGMLNTSSPNVPNARQRRVMKTWKEVDQNGN